MRKPPYPPPPPPPARDDMCRVVEYDVETLRVISVDDLIAKDRHE